MPKRLWFACLFIIPILAGAQPKDSVRSLYIKSYTDKFFLWPVLKQRSLSFELQHTKEIGNTVQFKPNNSYGLGLGMYLFDIGFELVFAVPVEELKQSAFGKTSATDLQLNILSRRWGGDVFYQSYSGFYLANPDHPLADGVHPQRPDIRTENWGVSGVYVFNKDKFSLRSAFTFADRQLKSSGSFVLSGTFNSFTLSADSAILNKHYSTRIGLNDEIKYVNNKTFGVAPGYSYNFIVKKFFLSLSLAIGPAAQWINYHDVSEVEHSVSTVNTYIDARVAFGYSTDRFFSGITFTNQTRNTRFENIQFSSNSSTARLLFGWRFQEVGLLKKSVWSLLPPWGKK